MSEKFNGRPYGRERRPLFYLTFLSCICLFMFSYLQSQTHQYVHVQVVWAGLLAGGTENKGYQLLCPHYICCVPLEW